MTTRRAPRTPKRYWSRRQRRVLLALLTGAENLSGFTLCQIAQTGSWAVYPLLDWLEDQGWVIGEWEQSPPPEHQGRRRFYHLTDYGRAEALRILGLAGGSPWE